MTDEVQKIREAVVKLKSNLMYGACSSQVAMETRCKEEAYNEVLAILDSMQEEPVSEELEEELPKVWDRETLDEYAYQVAYDLSNDWLKETATWDDVETAVKLGAKWQEKQDKETIELAEDHAMLAGMEKMKEQMMEKAIDGKVLANGMGNPILHLWDKGRHLIDKKVKVIVIKED